MELKPSYSNRPFPKFSFPKREGFFSVDERRNYHNSMFNLRYLSAPRELNFSLNDGDDTYVEKLTSAEDEKLSHLLTYIMNNKSVISRENAPEFVCFRGLLRMIMSTPYDNRESWIVLATYYKRTIYLCAAETESKKAEKMRKTARDEMFRRYGFKFENFVLSSHPHKPPPGHTKPVNESEEFCIMFSSKLNGKKLLYGAEIDGLIAKEPCTSLEYLRKVPLVEVKVKRIENNERQLQNFYRFKSRNWWLQSFLVGIDAIHVGLRNDDGIVEGLEQISLKDLYNEVKNNDYWNGAV
ncbi:CLUMA_CG002247, isoform A [Clunio marinus]|uniref:Decapping nuclease n=1 Tax=Clunio marinus TaxID=568069 RepID=A0A1J1HQE8_9DIPT|nr:CLUMA_CG002247, isoform A [Clunio marinus]